MAQATISARIDEKDKQAFDNFCSDVGLFCVKDVFHLRFLSQATLFTANPIKNI